MKPPFIKYYFLILVTLLCVVTKNFVFADGGENSSVSIRGSSNINEFELVNDNPEVDKLENGEIGSRYRNIKIAVDGFTAENKKMVDDFRKMVNASENPYIKIALEKRELADFEETSGLTNFNTIITIAGTKREYTIPLEVIRTINSGYVVKGSFSLELTDFELKPPEKLFGLVKVKNDVFINFTLSFDSEVAITKN